MRTQSEVESLFSQKASTWDQKYSENGPLRYRLDAFKDRLGELAMPPAKVLDFGCGTGNLAGYLTVCGYTVTACDISAKMIQRAKETNPGAPVEWIALPEDSRDLPFEGNRFDAVVSSSCFEYLTDLDATFSECRRVLKPGGYLIATVPNPQATIRKVEKILRPFAVAAGPLLKPIRKLDSYAIYLKCSRNRMSIEQWYATGNKKQLTKVDQNTSVSGDAALAFLRFRKQIATPNNN
jgi:ubiquinone/menaquinone biosynthesis C-methylase UbiE